MKEPKEYSTVELINRTIDRIEALQSKLDIHQENAEYAPNHIKRDNERSRAKYYRDMITVNKSVLAHLVYTSNKVSYVYI